MTDAPKSQGKESPASPVKSPAGGDNRPESPTTAQPLDFDDDLDAQTPTKPSDSESAPKPPPKDEVPPTKPPRPLSAKEQAENTLKEAFPSIDAGVITAVLAASGGQVEPAFNALLGMTDPDSQREPEPPARPPRPALNTSTQQSQLEADEQYARQLHEHYANSERARQQGAGGHGYNEDLQGSRLGRPGGQGGNPTNPEDRSEWRSFVDNDLPEIRESIRQGFLDTQTTVNRWITSFKKTIDGEGDEDYQEQQARIAQNNVRQQHANRRSSEMRRSQDLARYDADPQVIGDDFSKLDLKDGEYPPRTSSRPLANPNLFRPDVNTTRTKSPGIARKVSFQDGPPEEIHDAYSTSNKSSAATATSTIEAPATGAKASKWQPLSKADPSPITENDPFSLGDSDDEKDSKPITMRDEEEEEDKAKVQSTKEDDEAERLRKGLSEATADTIGIGDMTDGKKDSKAGTKN